MKATSGCGQDVHSFTLEAQMATKGHQEDLVKKMPFEERLEGGEEVSLEGIWARIFHAEALSREQQRVQCG